ncbi:putative pumilio-family RNA binding repeat domain-containing protein [Zalerion maritima]|uniref:Nucleolar protein 9 n=1 Tax=Zalerion maritima TaxID=339359 RepID=A0AAD5WVV2_9PEZI|nr:putative pumilio-family RNA binding repeat domain-containing protein [Zalerion maritima]
MPKKRSKRNEIREERKRKRQEREDEQETTQAPQSNKPDKKRRIDSISGEVPTTYPEDEDVFLAGAAQPEAEYFGQLDDSETSTFHHIDSTLRDHDSLATSADVEGHVEMAFSYADGKELKLACSQSFSRFLERLIWLSNTEQKKSLLKKFAGHYMSLLQHRFASHICETLFTACAPVVEEEMKTGFVETEATTAVDEEGKEVEVTGVESMETLFLATLDEMEGHLDFLLTDRFGSHTLRVLLLILSGRPLAEEGGRGRNNNVVHSKSKEDVTKDITVQREWMKETRRVPESFGLAASKIIEDSTGGMDTTTLRVMARHPIGNPTLQLLLDLDILLTKDTKNKKDESEGGPILLATMLPGAPKSLSDPESAATDFVKTLIFDQLGSRLLEVLIAKCPGKIFKPIFSSILKPRMDTYVKNETAAYTIMKALCRLNKADLEESFEIIEPLVPILAQKHRYNMVTTLFERCNARGCQPQIERLTAKLSETYGWGYDKIIPNLFLLSDKDDASSTTTTDNKKQTLDSSDPPSLPKPRISILPHAANLANSMLSISGKPRKAIQTSLSKLSRGALLSFSTESAPTAAVVVKALQVPPEPNPKPSPGRGALKSPRGPHKLLFASLTTPATQIMTLALSKHGHNVLNAIAAVPMFEIPFHMKQNVVSVLAQHEDELRASKEGRRVWYAWNGVLYTRNLGAWCREMKRVGLDGTTVGSGTQNGSEEGEDNGGVSNKGHTAGGAECQGKKLRPIDLAMMRAAKANREGDMDKKKRDRKERRKSMPLEEESGVVNEQSQSENDDVKNGESKAERKDRKRKEKKERRKAEQMEEEISHVPVEVNVKS